MTVAELTAEAIAAMPAGREMDALVAEKVFGWKWVTEDAEQPDAVPYLIKKGGGVFYPTVAASFPGQSKAGGDVSDYSTDIAAAMEAAELFPHFHLRHVHWADLTNHLSPVKTEQGRTHGAISHYENGWWAAGTDEGSICSFAETASLAICRTTLISKLTEQAKINVVTA